MRVFVRDNDVDQALRALKKKMQREGVFRGMRRRKAFTANSISFDRANPSAIAMHRR